MMRRHGGVRPLQNGRRVTPSAAAAATAAAVAAAGAVATAGASAEEAAMARDVFSAFTDLALLGATLGNALKNSIYSKIAS